MKLVRLFTLVVLALHGIQTEVCWGASDEALRDQATAALLKAATYYRTKVASHGGYVYHYSEDLERRWGEGEATSHQIWIQPPGTPTVGMAYLKAYRATGDQFYLEAALEAARGVIYGQLKSGGWTYCVDFDPAGARAAEYRNGESSGKNNSTLDDGITQSALRLLIQIDEALEFRDREVHESVRIALDALLHAQYPNGAFPQVWTGPVPPKPVVPASFPPYNWRTEGRVKNYWDMYTLNDGVAGHVADVLIQAYAVYGKDQYAAALARLGDFLILAQMPAPQPAWAQQYSYDMHPIWARRFEPPAVTGGESQDVLETLLKIHQHTKNEKYLRPIPSALAYLKGSLLPDGRLARYYELDANQPLYMNRRGRDYYLTHDDTNLPDHYGWKVASRLDAIQQAYEQIMRSGPVPAGGPAADDLVLQVRRIVEQLDSQGRWLSTSAGERLVGDLRLPAGRKYLSSAVFSRNVVLLSEYLAGKGA